MSKLTVFMCVLLLLPSMLWADQDKESPKQQPVDPMEQVLSSMSFIEQYCSGVATIDYSIQVLRDQGVEKIEAATLIVEDLSKAFPDERPLELKYMVATLTQDVFTYRSLHIDTLVAYHFYSCIEGVSSQKGIILGDTRLSENILQAVSCEAPGVSLYPCLMNIFGFEIPKEVKEGAVK